MAHRLFEIGDVAISLKSSSEETRIATQSLAGEGPVQILRSNFEIGNAGTCGIKRSIGVRGEY